MHCCGLRRREFAPTLLRYLQLRGSREFVSVNEYADFLSQTVALHRNAGREAELAVERAALSPLPAAKMPTYTRHNPRVRKWSTITVARNNYSVPSRLIGETLDVRLHPQTVEVRFANQLVETFPRLRGSRQTRIDYRHIAWSLARKPGAFARYRFREELFPTLVFRRAYDALVTWRGSRADVEYVRILLLTASTMQRDVEVALETLLHSGERFCYAKVQEACGTKRTSIPDVSPKIPDLLRLDRLIGGVR